MATPITATINTTTKEAIISGTSSLRETIALTVVNIGTASAAALTAAIFDGDNTRLAEGMSFAASGDNALGDINLNTEELIAAFALSNNRDKKTFTLVITDGATEDVLCNTKIKIIYTPDAGVTPVPVTGDGVAYTSGEKTKLAGIAESATANDTDATLLARENHTGTQTADTISDFDAEVSNNIDVAANTLVKHGHANFSLLETLTQTEVNLADAVTKKHAHTNSALLETFTQTEANLADAVTKKHSHTNLTTIEKFTEDAITGKPLYAGNSLGGDLRGPEGATPGNIVIFDPTDETGKLTSDSGKAPANYLEKNFSSLTEKTTLVDADTGALNDSESDPVGGIKKFTLSNLYLYLKSKFDAVYPSKLTSDTTVNFTSNMTAAQIQALIDAQPKNLNGYTLTFQFGDGTYNTSMTSQISFYHFYAGYLVIQGNISEANAATLHATQEVFLDFSAGTSHGIYVENCLCLVTIRNLKVQLADAPIVVAIFVSWAPRFDITYNYVLAAGKTFTTIGIATLGGTGQASFNYVSNLVRGIYAIGRTAMYSNGNDDIETQPTYGIYAASGGTIAKNGTQPAGSTSAEYYNTGGLIR